jgi:hypothetical protein
VVLKGKTRQLDETLYRLIEAALNGASGAEDIYVNTNGDLRFWRVEYHPYGKSRRALVLMYPTRRKLQVQPPS